MSLADLGMGLVDTAATGVINQAFVNYNRKQDYKAWEKGNDKAFRQSQEAQRNSAANMAEGYDRAGLSKALLAGANFSPAVSQQAPMPSKDVKVDSALARSSYYAQLENMDVQNKLLRSQAEHQDLENKKLRGKMDFDYNSVSQALDHLTDKALFANHPDLQYFGESLKQVLQDSEYVDDELYRNALQRYTDYERMADDQFGKELSIALNKAKNAPGVIGYFGEGGKPEVKLSWVESQVQLTGDKALKQLVASTDALLAGKKLTDKQVESFQETVKKLKAETSKLSAEQQKIESENIGELLKKFDMGNEGANAGLRSFLLLLKAVLD